jgi:hypothetical protein
VRTVIGIVLILLFGTGESVEAQVSSGSIHGIVRDSEGAHVANASVTIRNSDTGLERDTRTDRAGIYRFFLLAPGSYELRVEAPGLTIQTRRPIDVLLGQSLGLDIELTSAALEQEIVVVGQVPLIEGERTHQVDRVSELGIDNLPTDRRNPLDLSLLMPGVTNSEALVSFSLPHAENSRLSVAGQSGRSNSVLVDGVDNNDNSVAGVRSALSLGAVQQFQLNRSNTTAESGRATGGLISMVSRSGQNDFSGQVFALLRNRLLDARNAFAFGSGGTPVDPPYSRLQSGFSIGGPMARNRSFFFLAYEGMRQRESNFSTTFDDEASFQPTPSQEAVIQTLEGAPDPLLRSLGDALEEALTTSEATYPETVRLLGENSGVSRFRNNENRALLRIDRAVSGSNQMFVRANLSDVDQAGAFAGGLNGRSRGANFQIQDADFVFGNSYSMDASHVNEFRFQFAHRRFHVGPADPFGPELNISGMARLGRDFFLPSARSENRFQWVDNFTLASGNHELKFGGDFHYLSFDTQTEVGFGGRFIFGEAVALAAVIDDIGGGGASDAVAVALAGQSRPDLVPALSEPITSLQAFNLGLPLAYQQGFGDPRSKSTNKLVAAYLQDTFRVAPSLTLDLGLRYDVELQPTPLNRDGNNLAPRLGFAYSPNSRMVIRGGYGIYYAPVYQTVAFIERVLSGRQVSQIFVPLNGLPELGIDATAPEVWQSLREQGIIGSRQITDADIAPLGLVVGATPPVLERSAPSLVNPRSQQVSFSIERDLGGEFIASLGYLMNKGTQLLRSRNTNLQITGANRWGPTFGPIDDSLLQDNQVESSGSAIYHGMTALVRKRFSDFYQVQATYTLSKAIDDATDFTTELQAANQLDLRAERSLAASDQRHRFVLSGVFTSPFERGFGIGKFLADLTVSPIVTLASGHPFNLLLGFDANQDTNANTDRPPQAGRNTGRGPGFASVDLRLTKGFGLGRDYRLEAIAEVFNLFNSVNYSGVNNVVGTTLESYDVEGVRQRSPVEPLGFTSAFAPRKIQLGLKFRF